MRHACDENGLSGPCVCSRTRQDLQHKMRLNLISDPGDSISDRFSRSRPNVVGVNVVGCQASLECPLLKRERRTPVEACAPNRSGNGQCLHGLATAALIPNPRVAIVSLWTVRFRDSIIGKLLTRVAVRIKASAVPAVAEPHLKQVEKKFAELTAMRGCAEASSDACRHGTTLDVRSSKRSNITMKAQVAHEHIEHDCGAHRPGLRDEDRTRDSRGNGPPQRHRLLLLQFELSGAVQSVARGVCHERIRRR